jgi:hypothetical protein
MRRFDPAKVGFYPVREPDASFTLPRCYSISQRIFKRSLMGHPAEGEQPDIAGAGKTT